MKQVPASMNDSNVIGQMPQGPLLRADIMCSRIGFGGSRLHYLASSRERQHILETAYSCGINYFDTAPLYGHGLAECALGEFLKRHESEREKLVVATKWGLPAVAWIDWLPESGMRYAVALETIRRKFLGNPARPLLTPEFLIRSVEASLRRLNTHYIDILWMHEPEPRWMPEPAAVLGALSDLCASGKVRFVGIAGYPAHVEPTVQAFTQVTPPEMPLLRQCDEQSWTVENVPDVTFGAISQGPQRRGAIPIDAAIAVDRLRAALTRREQGVVLVSTTRPDNIRQLAVQAVTVPCDEI